MGELRGVSINFRPLLAGLAALLLVLAGGGVLMALRGNAAVTHLQVEGSFQRVPPEAVRAAAAAQLATGFLSANLDAIRAGVEALPWVERARVERVWPADIRVRVWEREPLARWGEAALLSTRAVPFTPPVKDIPPGLPRLFGPPGHEREVMEAYQRLSSRLAATPFPLASLVEDARGEWVVHTAGGIELRLGQGAPDGKLDTIAGPLARALGQRLQEVSYVDLRYTNGFAVAWHAPVPAAGERSHE